MADKEFARETIGNSHQQAGYQVPSLTSKPLKQAQDLKSDTTNQAEPAAPGGYYFNVAQKGKLILPTALWILLVLAGVSFLTLLASLNRTVDTLDMLVELAQEEAALDNLHDVFLHQNNHHEHDKKPSGKRHQDQERHHDEKNWPDRVESSWLALPSWVSLEPMPREPSKQAASHPHDHHAATADVISSFGQLNLIPPHVQSSLNHLFRQAGQIDQISGGNSMPEVSGSFIISSSSSNEASSQKPADMMDSIMKQMMPLFAGPDSGPNKNSHQEPAATKKSPQERDQDRPLLSANIENLNINVNINGTESAQSDDVEEKAGAGRKRRPAAIEREESDELEQTVNSLISKLMAPPVDLSQTSMGPFRPEVTGQPLEMVRIGSSLDDENIRHRRPQSSPSFMPIGLGSFMNMPMRPQEYRRPHHHHQPQVIPDQFIISIASDEPQTSGQLSNLASMLANGDLKDATQTQSVEMRRPQPGKPGSPYELPVGSPMSALLDSIRDFEEVSAKRPSQDETQRIKDNAKWDVLANDLADSLLSSMIPEQQANGGAFGLPQASPDMPIVLVNGKPLDESERQKSPLISAEAASSQHKGKDNTEAESTQAPSSASTDRPDEDLDMGDLFSFLIGSRKSSTTPSSSTKSLDQTTTTPIGTDEPSMSMDKLMGEMTDKLNESFSTPSTTADDSKASSQTATAKDSLGELLNAHIVPTTTSSTGAADEKITKKSEHDLVGESVLNDLLGSIFTMPQFGNDQPQRSTSDSSSGSSSSGSNSSRETMLCDCQKVPSNSTNRRQQNATSNTSSTRLTYSSSSGGGSSGGNGNNDRRGGSSSDSGWSSSSYGTSGGSGGTSSSGGSDRRGGQSNDDSRSSSSYGTSNDGGGSNSNRGGSSSSGGGDRGSSSSNRQDGPIGYVAYNGRPENAPSAFAVASLMADQVGRRQSPGDQQADRQSDTSEPVANARPGSLLSALNNSTNHLLPRIIKRLNNTSISSLKFNPNDSSPTLITPLL